MKKFFNLTFIFVIAVLIFFLISPYIFKYQKYSKRTLQKEYDYIKSKIEVFHIGRFLENSFDLKEIEVPKMMNRYEFFNFLVKTFNNVPEVYFKIPFQDKSTNLLPFDVRYLDGAFIVVSTACEIPKNSKILRINNKEIFNIFNDYQDAGTGNNIYVKRQNFALTILPLLPDFERIKKFEVEYQYNDRLYKANVEAITYEEYKKKVHIKPFEYIKLNYKFGILKVNHFDVSGKEFYEMLTLLESISNDNISTLIIDMRGSYGFINDLSGVYMLLSFLVDKSYYISDEIIYSFGKSILKYENYGYVQPNENNFSNKRLVFISDEYITHPLPMLVLSFIKKWKIGLIIGDYSSFPANFYGSMKEFATHWTNIKFLIPTWYLKNYKEDYIKPDIIYKGDYVKYIIDNF